MAKSIIQSEKVCYLTGATNNLDLHHLMNGAGYRDKADKYGLTIWLEHSIHMKIHETPSIMYQLKQLAQKEFEKIYSHELWMKEFNKNYL